MYSFDARVRYSECDQTGRLSLESVVNYLQDCSTFQSEDLGQGFETLERRGLAWVLATWRIEVGELPRLGERLVVSTWCYEMTRSHALRCFAIEDGEGRRVVSADSQWFVLDRSSGHVTRVPEDQRVYLSDEPRLPMPPLERRMRPEGPFRACARRTVRPHHLDTNRHMNNAQYVLVAKDALDELGFYEEIRGVSVLYRRMALLGDDVTPLVYRREDGFDVSLTDDEGTEYALVRIRTGR